MPEHAQFPATPPSEPSTELAIALYLGESYASLGVFDSSALAKTQSLRKLLFEKSVFLPQVSFKNLLNQTKLAVCEKIENENVIFKNVFIVSRYFDRLKNFRLGGSVVQVVIEGFENSYQLSNSKALSLAAASLIISVTENKISEDFLESELQRLKKINPDVNKVVIQLPEEKISTEKKEMVHHFFEKAEFKIFNCAQPTQPGVVRQSLLNAGIEGTKEEILNDLKEVFTEDVEVSFWINNGFTKTYNNFELFNSANNFLTDEVKQQKLNYGAYFDHETFRFISSEKATHWNSPWGQIPIDCFQNFEMTPHPFSEIKLDHLSLLTTSQTPTAHEPGPVLAGRGIKPLVIDLFHTELAESKMMHHLFPNMLAEQQRSKLNNHLSVLEKGQRDNLFSSNKEETKKMIQLKLLNDVLLNSQNQPALITGPLNNIINVKNHTNLKSVRDFSWPIQIMKKASL